MLNRFCHLLGDSLLHSLVCLLFLTAPGEGEAPYREYETCKNESDDAVDNRLVPGPLIKVNPRFPHCCAAFSQICVLHKIEVDYVTTK